MCQAIPREVIAVRGDRAQVLVDGRPAWVGASAVAGLRPGEYAIVYAGQATERLERAEAEALLREIADLDALFEAMMPEAQP